MIKLSIDDQYRVLEMQGVIRVRITSHQHMGIVDNFLQVDFVGDSIEEWKPIQSFDMRMPMGYLPDLLASLQPYGFELIKMLSYQQHWQDVYCRHVEYRLAGVA